MAGNGTQPAIWTLRDWSILTLLVFFAVALRLLFFNGFFGSDDLTYLQRSTQIAHGIWTSGDYNGALRYGYNIPAALFIYLFGLNTFTANAWTLFCSLAEIALVYFFAARYIGRKAAVIAALVLACIPLHIAVGTRIHADSVFAFFLTLSFVLFYMAEQSGNRKFYFATGLSLGMIFWVKELGIITFLAFASYPILTRRFNKDWLWVIGGGLIMLAGHLILMEIIAGDPLYLIKTVTGQVQRGVTQESYEDSAGYYFKYLFVDIRHTWIAPFLSALAIAGILSKWRTRGSGDASIYVAWWLLGLLIVLSFTPVSLNPIRLAMKQSNYLNLFLAPIALLSGRFLAETHSRAVGGLLLAVTILGGIALGALEQHAYHVFTANSKAAIAFIKSHPDDWILGSVNNADMARVMSILDRNAQLAERFGYLARDTEIIRDKIPAVGRSPMGYAVLDLETSYWGKYAVKLDTPPPCWREVQRLEPMNSDIGYLLLRIITSVSEAAPDLIRQKIQRLLLSNIVPKAATVYRVDINDLWCKSSPPLGYSKISSLNKMRFLIHRQY
jgi:hypothetical protein